MTTVIFACVHNAGRSQMAAALFNLLADPALARAISAGTAPGDRIHPEGQSLDRVREIREKIRARVVALQVERGWERT